MTFSDGATLASLALNLILLLFQSQVKAALAELKANIYKDFIRKDDIHLFVHGGSRRASRE
jgi:hypothetical protein